MKFTGKAEEIAIQLLDLFKNGDPGQAMASLFLKGGGRHFESWSFNNRIIALLNGYTDAMGFKQWLAKGRTVKKGEKAFYILGPLACKGERKNASGGTEQYTFIRGFKGIPVFGYEQTEGEQITYESDKIINSLPLVDVAQNWGINVGTYSGREGKPNGYFSPNNMAIMLGVQNVTTWLHELVHAAEHQCGMLTTENYTDQKLEAEIVAELGATVLCYMLGLNDHADNGGCWQYISSWAKHYQKDPAEAAYKLIDRTCKAIDCIMKCHEETLTPELATV